VSDALPRRRLTAVDALRGLVMIIMALDHARDFFHAGAMSQSPTDLATTTPLLFATRWVTHLCAPVFMFLAGTSAFLWLQVPGRTTAGLSRFLVTRGLWLIVLEILVMRFAFDLTYSLGMPVLLITLFALGSSMLVLAVLVHLPSRIVAAMSVAVILLHNVTDGVRSEQFAGLGWLWTLLHQPGAILLGPVVAVVGYPVVPWFAVMALGYACGSIVQQPSAQWRRTAWRAGLALTIGFVILRAINVYGDPSPWSVQPSAVGTVLSFLNTTKYPASLSFLLMTLGPAALLLAWLSARDLGDRHPLLVFGRVPLFYFLVHFLLLHLLLVAATFVRYGSGAAAFLWRAPPSMGGPRELFPPDFGYGLGGVYLAWAVAVMLMYPLCQWFGALRRRRADWWWLSYL
jgi:uncharacterized membrane protein